MQVFFREWIEISTYTKRKRDLYKEKCGQSRGKVCENVEKSPDKQKLKKESVGNGVIKRWICLKLEILKRERAVI
ncbi:hypothetical protein CYJ27_01165 [Aerococcus christensenii]|uniref:Uncharacterized protein n=1 Tax=Aerococcus christensenii TaxID=87541 RepID=A0A2I1K8W4_9LACT|nr:hypothetical protein CYJ27_01165 [Aerococcus christensenii]